MAGRLDRYVTRNVASAYLAALVSMLLLTVVIDLLMQLPDYVRLATGREADGGELAEMLARYYLYMLPMSFVTIAPFVTVIASMFAVSRMIAANEIAPMVFTGRSMYRVLRPVLAMGLLSALAMAATWELVMPLVSEPRSKLAAELTSDSGAEAGDPRGRPLRQLVLRTAERRGELLFANRYYHELQRIEGVTLYQRGAVGATHRIVDAPAAVWNPELGDWELEDGLEHIGDRSRPVRVLGIGGVPPERLWQSAKDRRMAVELSYSDLAELRELRPGRPDFVLSFHHHITFPLANIVLLLLAVPFAVHWERGGKVLRVLVAIGICAAYLVVDLSCQSLGMRGMNPIVAAWVPTILFGSLGAVFFSGVRT